jgi:hypothetical protein
MEGYRMMGQLSGRFTLVAFLCLAIAPLSGQQEKPGGQPEASAPKKASEQPKASAQKKVEQAGNISKTASIVAIDHTKRIVTLKGADGNLEDVHAGPEVKRFDELKVGDSVTFSYHAAMVYEVHKPGTTAAPIQEGVGTVRGQGPKPSGAVTQQQQATVTVEAIDPAVPSMTVRTEDGHVMSARIQDKKNLEGLKVGDKIVVTFTEALMITVEAPKK